jgi:AraC-like DNA-binding protein
MREVTIKCDCCGAAIEGNPIQYWLCETDRETQNIKEDYFHPDIDICKSCADGLTEQVAKYFDKERKKPKKKETKKRETKKTEIDMGKVHALLDAGWKMKDIAGDLKCSEQTIRKRLKEEKNNDEIQ